MKNRFIMFIGMLFVTISLNAEKVTLEKCSQLGEGYIFAGGECIQYFRSKGDTEGALNILVHGTWPEGTNILGRYSPFAETLSMATDVSTIALALPGYSNSSTNNFTALTHEGVKNLSAKEEYIRFLGEVIKSLKDKYEAETITYIGHSAGASMGATLTGFEPELINNIVLVGGRYNIHEKVKDDNLVSIVDVLDRVNKKTKFLLIYGSNDKISEPKVTKDFYNLALKKGFDVRLTEVKNGVHLDLDMTDTSIEAITQMLEE